MFGTQQVAQLRYCGTKYIFCIFHAFSCIIFQISVVGIWFNSAYQDVYEIIAVCPCCPLNWHKDWPSAHHVQIKLRISDCKHIHRLFFYVMFCSFDMWLCYWYYYAELISELVAWSVRCSTELYHYTSWNVCALEWKIFILSFFHTCFWIVIQFVIMWNYRDMSSIFIAV